MTTVGVFNVGRPEPWMDRAACKSEDPDWFFVGPNEDQNYAKSICKECPVRKECLQFAVDHNEIFGIWGGLGPRDRMLLKRGSRQRRTLDRCIHNHDLTDVGLTPTGGCRQCQIERHARHEQRRRQGLAAPRGGRA